MLSITNYYSVLYLGITDFCLLLFLSKFKLYIKLMEARLYVPFGVNFEKYLQTCLHLAARHSLKRWGAVRTYTKLRILLLIFG